MTVRLVDSMKAAATDLRWILRTLSVRSNLSAAIETFEAALRDLQKGQVITAAVLMLARDGLNAISGCSLVEDDAENSVCADRIRGAVRTFRPVLQAWEETFGQQGCDGNPVSIDGVDNPKECALWASTVLAVDKGYASDILCYDDDTYEVFADNGASFRFYRV